MVGLVRKGRVGGFGFGMRFNVGEFLVIWGMGRFPWAESFLLPAVRREMGVESERFPDHRQCRFLPIHRQVIGD